MKPLHACEQTQGQLIDDPSIVHHASRTMLVLWLTLITMGVEITAGYWFGSMALTADGWHMGSHAGAMAVVWITYRLTQSPTVNQRLTFGSGKMIALGGFTSALILAVIAISILIESAMRFSGQHHIYFNEALGVAVIGLAINLISAKLLHHGGHDHEHEHEHDHDHPHADSNIRSAYLHVLADALTSVLAIVALLCGKYLGWEWMDAAVGVLGGVVILHWAYGLIKQSGAELLDARVSLDFEKRLAQSIDHTGSKVVDLHVWKLGPRRIAAEVIIESSQLRGAEFFRNAILTELKVGHLVVEERIRR